MTLDQVQPAAVAKLSASAALTAFGAPFAFDPHADEEQQIQLFNARVQATGAALRVGSITCPRSEETIGGVLTPLTAEGIVFFAEKKGHAHTPRALERAGGLGLGKLEGLHVGVERAELVVESEHEPAQTILGGGADDCLQHGETPVECGKVGAVFGAVGGLAHVTKIGCVKATRWRMWPCLVSRAS